MKYRAYDLMKQKLEDAKREHQQALDEAIRQFNELSPEEQMREQLRKWEYLLTAKVN